MLLRSRTGADLPACVVALEAVHAVDDYPSRWPDDPAAWLTPAGTRAAWVAEADGVVAGHVCLRSGLDDAQVAELTGTPPQRLALVARLFVVPGAQGRGVATALLGEAVSGAEADGLLPVLEVVDGGAAQTLYERLGWQHVVTRPASWVRPSGERPTARIYRAPDPGRSAT